MAKPVLQDFERGLTAVLTDPKAYMVAVLGIVGIMFQQVGLSTGRLAATVAAGSVMNPIVSVLLGVTLLEERLSRPLLGTLGLGLALFAAVAITLIRRSDDERAAAAQPA
jgi:EamA domain-containing membrane protein RarD